MRAANVFLLVSFSGRTRPILSANAPPPTRFLKFLLRHGPGISILRLFSASRASIAPVLPCPPRTPTRSPFGRAVRASPGPGPRRCPRPQLGNGSPLQYSCLENSHGQRSLAGYSPWVAKSRTRLAPPTPHPLHAARNRHHKAADATQRQRGDLQRPARCVRAAFLLWRPENAGGLGSYLGEKRDVSSQSCKEN